MKSVKWKLKNWFKRTFALYDIDDIRWACRTCGDAKDRDDFEWKVIQALKKIQEGGK